MSKIQFGQVYVSYNSESTNRKIDELRRNGIPYATHTVLTREDTAAAKAAGDDFSKTPDFKYSVLIGSGKRDKAKIEKLPTLSDESPKSPPGEIILSHREAKIFDYLLRAKEL